MDKRHYYNNPDKQKLLKIAKKKLKEVCANCGFSHLFTSCFLHDASKNVTLNARFAFFFLSI